MNVEGAAPFAENALFQEDWPAFGWIEDVRPALQSAQEAGRSVALATLFRVEGSAPRSPGVQMLFDGERAAGFFSGGCVEADVARHAADVIADGRPRLLHYGAGSPWIDIKLTCGGAIHIFVERIGADSAAARTLLAHRDARTPALWISNGEKARVEPAGEAPLFSVSQEPLTIARRYDPPRRLVVSGWDPTALAIAKLGVDAQFETFLARSMGPALSPPIDGVVYHRSSPHEALGAIGIDPWTVFIGATHDAELDIPACALALKEGAGYVGLVGAASRVPDRKRAMVEAGASEEMLARLHAPAGIRSLGKSPWGIAVGIIAEVLQTMSDEQARA